MGVLAGVYVRTMDQIVSLEKLLVLPFGFLGGIFYSVSPLPPAWQVLSDLNPVFYVVQVCAHRLPGLRICPRASRWPCSGDRACPHRLVATAVPLGPAAEALSAARRRQRPPVAHLHTPWSGLGATP